MLDLPYYRLELDDYAAAAFTSFSKDYYGTLDDILRLMDALENDEDLCKSPSKHYSRLFTTSSRAILPSSILLPIKTFRFSPRQKCCIRRNDSTGISAGHIGTPGNGLIIYAVRKSLLIIFGCSVKRSFAAA